MKKLLSYCDPVMRISSVDISEGYADTLRRVQDAGKIYEDALQALIGECERSNLDLSFPYEIKRRIKLTKRYISKFNVFLNSVVLSPDGTDTDDMQGFTNYAAFIEECRNFDFDENQKRLRERAAKLMPELAEAFLRRPSPKL